MSISRPFAGLSGAVGAHAGIQHLPLPGQVNVPLPKNLLADAPWIFVVVMAFGSGWAAGEITLLVLALTPLVVLLGVTKRV
jgi:hypothetical protein